MQYFADDFSAMAAGNLSLTAGLIAAGYSELENSGIPSTVAVIAQPSLPAGLQNDLRFPSAASKQVLRFTLTASDIEARLLWSGFPNGVQTVSVSWWEYRAAGNLGGEKFCRVGNFVSGPGSNRGVDSIITLGQVSGTTLIANSANMHDYGDHPMSPGIAGWPGLNHFEAVYGLSTGTNSDGSVSLYENGSLIGQATGLQFFNTPSSNAIQLWDIGGWSSSSGGTEGTVTYPITRYICAIRIAPSYQGLWLMSGARTMIITGVRTLTQALAAPALSSAVSGTTATLNWAAPTPTGQSVIGGFRLYKAASVGGPYTQVGSNLPAGQLSATDTLSATQFYKVEAFDQYQTGGSSAVTSCVPQTGQIKFHPGHYMGSLNTNGSAAPNGNARNAAEMDSLASAGANVHGIYFIYTWDGMEPTLGGYNFDGIRSDLAYLIAHCPGKRFGIMIWAEKFSGTGTGASGTPTYILNNPGLYGSGFDGIHGGYWALTVGSGPVGGTAAIWRPAVMDRYAALFEALAVAPTGDGFTFDTHPLVELVTGQESALSLQSGSDYTDAKFFAQMQSWDSRGKAAFPHTNFASGLNFVVGSAGLMAPYVLDAYNKQCAFTCPDIGTSFSWAQQALVGNVFNGTSFVAGGPDLRGKMPILPFVQSPDYSRATLAQMFSNAVAFGANQIWWTRISAGSGAVGDWSTVVLPFINANPLTATACPLAYNGQCFGG